MTVIGTVPACTVEVSLKLPSSPTITLRSFTSTVAPGADLPATVRFEPSTLSPFFGALTASGGGVLLNTTVDFVDEIVSVGLTSDTTT